MQTLLTGIQTFFYGTNWENLLKIIAILFHDHFLDSLHFMYWYCKEKFDVDHSWGLKGYSPPFGADK